MNNQSYWADYILQKKNLYIEMSFHYYNNQVLIFKEKGKTCKDFLIIHLFFNNFVFIDLNS